MYSSYFIFEIIFIIIFNFTEINYANKSLDFTQIVIFREKIENF